MGKAAMAGANVTMMTAELLTAGISRLAQMLEELKDWMEEHEYVSIAQMQGSMSQQLLSGRTI
jgi:dihydroorotate dehydrogenase (fumarate)